MQLRFRNRGRGRGRCSGRARAEVSGRVGIRVMVRIRARVRGQGLRGHDYGTAHCQHHEVRGRGPTAASTMNGTHRLGTLGGLGWASWEG